MIAKPLQERYQTQNMQLANLISSEGWNGSEAEIIFLKQKYLGKMNSSKCYIIPKNVYIYIERERESLKIVQYVYNMHKYR